MDQNRELSDCGLKDVVGTGEMCDPRVNQLYCKNCGCTDLRRGW